MLFWIAFAYLAFLGWASLRGPFPATVPLGSPTAYLNLYIHVPQSIAALLLGFFTLAAAVSYLKRPSDKALARLDRGAFATAVLSWLSFATGTLWAEESWGAAFSGDPRQLSVFVMAVLYSVYFVLRRSVEDPDRVGRVAAAYAVAAFVSIPAALIVPTVFHPSTGEALAALDMRMRGLYLASLALLLAFLGLWLSGRGTRRWSAPLALATALAPALFILLQYAGPVYRVYNATLEGGSVVATTSGGELRLSHVGLSPLVVNGTVVLVGHLIKPDGSVVIHWSVGVNLILTGAAVALLLGVRASGKL